MFITILKWEIALYTKRFGESLNLLAMFVMASSFFVLSLPYNTALGNMVPSILWVCALLVLALVQYRIFSMIF